MIKKLLKRLENNLLLKLLSVLIAIVIWYVVVSGNDPVETQSYNVKITVANDTYIANGKQIYRIDDSYKSTTVYLRGNRSVLRDISSEDITVTADLTQIVDMERDPVMVPLAASCRGISAANITMARTAIPIQIENIARKVFPVVVDSGNSSPGKDYEIGRMTANPEQIAINGPESIINGIESVIARIDVTGMTADGTKKATLRLLDSSQNQISQVTIDDDLTFVGGEPNVTVAVDLWRKQGGVSFNVEFDGKPQDGYHIASWSTTPETITVVGTDAALARLSENDNKITIPSSMISVAGMSHDFSQEINLDDILPADIRAAENTSDTVTVNVTILSDESRVVTLDVDNIELLNLPGSLVVSYDQADIDVRIRGEGTLVNKVTPAAIKASIDLGGLGAGDHMVPVTLVLPDEISLVEPVSVEIHLKEAAEPTPAEEES